MIPSDLLQLVMQFGTWIIFGYLYFAERGRNDALQAQLIKTVLEHEQFVITYLCRDDVPMQRTPIYPPQAIPKQ